MLELSFEWVRMSPRLTLRTPSPRRLISDEVYSAAVKAAGGSVTLTMVPDAPHAALAQLGAVAGQTSLQHVAEWILNH